MFGNNDTIGGIAEGDLRRGLAIAGKTAFWVIYEGSVAYATYHAIGLFGGQGENSWASVLGVILVGASAAFGFPISVHYWFSGIQRLVGFAFYAADFALLFGVAVVSYRISNGIAMTGLVELLYEFAGGVPLVVGAMWAILWALDPEHEHWHIINDLQRASKVFKAKAMRDASKEQSITAGARAAAARDVQEVVSRAVGGFGSPAAPTSQYAREAPAMSGGHDDTARLLAENARLRAELAKRSKAAVNGSAPKE